MGVAAPDMNNTQVLIEVAPAQGAHFSDTKADKGRDRKDRSILFCGGSLEEHLDLVRREHPEVT